MLNSLLFQTGITLQLNLRLKYLIKRLTFWIQLFTKARDFTTKESLTSVGKALRLLRTKSSAKSFYKNIYNFKNTFVLEVTLMKKFSEVKFTERESAIQKSNEV